MGFIQSQALTLMWLKPNFLEDSAILIDLRRCIHIVWLCRLALHAKTISKHQNPGEDGGSSLFLKSTRMTLPPKRPHFDMMGSNIGWPHHKMLSNRKCIKGFYYGNEMIYLSTRLQTFGISYTLKWNLPEKLLNYFTWPKYEYLSNFTTVEEPFAFSGVSVFVFCLSLYDL